MWGHRIAVVGLAAVVLAACGAADDDDNAGSSTPAVSTNASATPTATTAPTPPATTADSTGGGGGGGGGSDHGHGGGSGGGNDDGIDSVQWGPDDPPIPGEYAAFAADRADGLACASIDDRAAGSDFWTLAADVCRAFAGEGDWPDVGSVPAPPSEDNPYQRCLDGELSGMLDAALAWHDDHPGQSPVVRYPASGTHSPCQRSLYDVGPTGERVDPDGGCDNDGSLRVPTPGVAVTVSAPGIPSGANPHATVGGALLCVVDSNTDNALRTFVVVVPSSGEEQTVRIDVETDYGTLHADVALPAVGGGTTGSSVTTTDDEPSTESTATTATTHGGPGTTDDR